MKVKITIILAIVFTVNLFGERLKDIVDIKGLPRHKLVGYGLVVGLKGTGDRRRNDYTIRSIRNMLERFGVKIDDRRIVPRNVAACIVTGEVSPFAKVNSRIDVTVSSIGDARNLRGGVLLLTPLLNESGEIFAYAQGPLSVSKDEPLTGRIPGGAVLLRAPRVTLGDTFSLWLHEPDFSVVQRIADAINSLFRNTATPLDAAEIKVTLPPPYRGRVVTFLAAIETLNVVTDVPARVVINQRTGTVIVGGNVTLSPCCIAHGELKIEILPETPVPPGSLYVFSRNVMAFQGATTVSDIATALNRLGAKPEDIIAIFQALKQAGALKAELVIL